MSTQTTQQEIARPFLKWAGGKSQLIQQYIPYFPPKFTTYYEPFLGGGALFFHLLPKVSILTDINADLVNVFRCVRDEVEPLIEFLQQHQMNHSKEYYYCVRLMQPNTPLERAARFIYLNKTCFNGLYRENSKGEFNVPIGKYKNPKICNPALLRAVSAALQSALIDVRPFEAVLQSAKTAEDFVFFDPPYYPLSPTSNFTAYSRNSFNEADQIRLRDVFAELANRGVKVMLSNSDCLFIREIYSNFNIYEISASRMINSNARKRGKISELLIASYAK
ncbi:DNA adenine methylase [Trichocoleus sp. DQ-A3]|uniref:DNA adenine methylase n=1 Tax=Cyanophyceae TaxID=3028117 RepID=UPI0016888FFC|nr:DNA adenine methylase [Coleofasciculus sp. FACHB-125]MBD1902523.1 DNA adenine methylase [Coleofasciculus sp. FACHB-125]